MLLLQDKRPAYDELIWINAEKIKDIKKILFYITHEQLRYYEKFVNFPLAEHGENIECKGQVRI